MTGRRGRDGVVGAGGPARRPGRLRGRGDLGAVTAETALALPAVVLVLAVVLTTGAAGAARLRCVDGARAGARLAAAGHGDHEVVAAARRVAGDDVAAAVRHEGTWVEVTARCPLPGSWFTGGRLTATGSATAWAEP
ncbi:TadE family type IV pilus minor pilin [Actinotalea sp. AC32]|nr:TadE family type IV pilus minor pilin [Actinotalea sp. AC32]